MADGSSEFGGSGFSGGTAAAAADVFGGTPQGSSMYGDEFQLQLNQGGIDYATLGKILAAAANQFNQQPQQAGYQNMVPPQSMTMRPPAGMVTNMPRSSMPNQNKGLDPATMQQLAAKKLAEEQAAAAESKGIGGALGTLAGGLAGFALGGPTGAAIGASAGGGLGKAIS
tara:strand:- start:43 stop:552 length:510 start_codon:yes stop_codon:yes gene_type:complete